MRGIETQVRKIRRRVFKEIASLAYYSENLIDDIILIVMSAVVWVFAWRRKQISRLHGIIMLAMYAGYMVYICTR